MTAARMAAMKRVVMIVAGLLLALLIGTAWWLYTPDEPRAALEARYAAAPSSFLQVAGLRLHLRDTGPRDARAVILMHGFGASLHTWEAWARLLETDHRMIRFDLPGFGLTGADPTGDYTDARSIAVLAGILDALGLREASLIGNSMGGRIAWMFAARHPERVDRLVLVAPDGFASPGRAYGVAPRVPTIARLLPYALPLPLLRASLKPAYGDPALLTEDVLTRYRDMLLAPGVRGAILARTGQDALVDPRPLLRQVRAPTLLVWGEQDAMIPVANASDYQQVLPDSRLDTFAGLGHVPHEESPARSLAPVRAFLAGNRPVERQ